jgi:hypothetical protein
MAASPSSAPCAVWATWSARRCRPGSRIPGRFPSGHG